MKTVLENVGMTTLPYVNIVRVSSDYDGRNGSANPTTG